MSISRRDQFRSHGSTFTLILARDEALIAAMCEALESIEILGQNPRVSTRALGDTFIGGSPGVTHMRIVLSPIWVNPETRKPFPIVLRNLREQLSIALKKTAAFFCRHYTSVTVPHYESLGRREVLEEDWFVDRELSRISSKFQFLLDITPVNPRAAFPRIRRGRLSR